MTSNTPPNINARTLKGSYYSLITSSITLILGVIRFTLLLYFLSPKDYGLFAQAAIFVAFTSQLRLPGLDLAIIQKKEINETIRRTYFSLKIIFLSLSLLVMALLTNRIGEVYPEMPLLSSVLFALLGVEFIKDLNGVQESLLRRDIAFKPIAIADVISAVMMTIITPILAWQGYGAWSLVAEVTVGQITRSIIFWLIYRVWWPRFGWERKIAGELWNFSLNLWAHSLLNFIVDRFDDFWIGRSMGQDALGHYSRAYEAARYPRRIIAQSLLSVFYSTFSRLQSNREELSKSFYILMSLMIRVSFGFSLIFIFVAADFIYILGNKWEPMLITFQLMIIYTLLDPLAAGAGDLIIAVGKPNLTVRTRLLQTAVFIPLVILLGNRFGIEGVAIAANVMITLGAILLFHYTHHFVDYSNRKLWGWPTVGLIITTSFILVLNPIWSMLNSFVAIICKLFLILVFYLGLLLLMERDQMKIYWRIFLSLINQVLKKS